MALSAERVAEIEQRVYDKFLAEHREKIVAESDAAYRSSLGRLWAANGAGAGIIASAKGIQTSTYLMPLTVFIFGLIALAAGEIIELVKKWRRLSEIESVDSWLDLRAGSFEKPTEKVGFSLRNAQTVSGIIAAITFIVATVWCLAKLAQ